VRMCAPSMVAMVASLAILLDAVPLAVGVSLEVSTPRVALN
jgi:hypothetical protein